jgi:ketosteroid isomerase-like protein
VINGKSEYMDRIQRCYRNNSDTFKVESTVVSEGGKTIVSFLINQFEQQSCDIFQFKDGKIISETEYLLGKIQ